MEVNTVDKATDTNGGPKDSDHKIGAENMNVDEPDHALDSVIVNITVNKTNDANSHPSQDSDDRIDAENSNVDEPDIIHDSSKTNDANAEQTESMVNDDVEQNHVFTYIN